MFIGTLYEITWSYNDIIGNVLIEFSRNGGVDWEVIENNVPNTGSYFWEVTGPSTNEGILRITSIDETDVSDISDGYVIVEYKCKIKEDYITLCGPEMNGRYGSCRNIDLINYLPLYLRETDTERFLQFFEDFLNEMFDGMCGFQNSSENLPITNNYIVSGVNAGDKNFTYDMSGSINTDANIVDKVTISWPSNVTEINPKISILEKIQRLTELHDPDLIDIDYIQFFAKNLGYNISINRTEIGSENFGFDSGLNIECSATDINKYLRFMVSNLPHWYKIKTTRNSIKVMLYSFGLIGDIIDFYTKDYSETVDGNWRLDYNDNLVDIPNEWYPSPHFGIVINIDESSDISFDIKKRDKLIKAIESVRPINTVFRRLVGYFQRTYDIWIGSSIRFTRYIKIESDGYSNSYTFPVAIISHPSNVYVLEGATPTFTVIASGGGILNYQWKRNNINVSGANSSSYTTAPITSYNNGDEYKCQVSNNYSSATSNIAYVTIIT